MRLGSIEKLREAEALFDMLTEANPDTMYLYNLAVLKSQLKKWDEATAALKALIERGYLVTYPDTLDYMEFAPLREARPQDFATLRQLAMQRSATGQGSSSQEPDRSAGAAIADFPSA
jgi:hypothetical protein